MFILTIKYCYHREDDLYDLGEVELHGTEGRCSVTGHAQVSITEVHWTDEVIVPYQKSRQLKDEFIKLLNMSPQQRHVLTDHDD